MANEILGQLSYATLFDESTWGTTPGSPPYVYCPVSGYDVKFKADSRQANPYLGIFQRKHNKNFRGMPGGGFTLPAWSYWIDSAGGSSPDMSLTEYILSWAYDNLDSTYLTSKGCQWAEGPNVANLQHNGLRVNSCALSGSADAGVVAIALDLMGMSEATFSTAQAIPDDMEGLVDFDFADAILTVNSAVIEMENFNLGLSNGLKAKYRSSANPSLMPRTTTAIDFSWSLIKNSDTYALALRTLATSTEYDIQLQLVGSHNGTGSSGTNTTILIDMPRCSLINPDDGRTKEDFTQTNIQTMVLKPDSSEDSINFTYGVA